MINSVNTKTYYYHIVKYAEIAFFTLFKIYLILYSCICIKKSLQNVFMQNSVITFKHVAVSNIQLLQTFNVFIWITAHIIVCFSQ